MLVKMEWDSFQSKIRGSCFFHDFFFKCGDLFLQFSLVLILHWLPYKRTKKHSSLALCFLGTPVRFQLSLQQRHLPYFSCLLPIPAHQSHRHPSSSFVLLFLFLLFWRYSITSNFFLFLKRCMQAKPSTFKKRVL